MNLDLELHCVLILNSDIYSARHRLLLLPINLLCSAICFLLRGCDSLQATLFYLQMLRGVIY
uniref:Uncharacterized protein n=1 Tax=Cannabis sativa TaxID=3483 RepID=A0A803QU43_CANSA